MSTSSVTDFEHDLQLADQVVPGIRSCDRDPNTVGEAPGQRPAPRLQEQLDCTAPVLRALAIRSLEDLHWRRTLRPLLLYLLLLVLAANAAMFLNAQWLAPSIDQIRADLPLMHPQSADNYAPYQPLLIRASVILAVVSSLVWLIAWAGGARRLVRALGGDQVHQSRQLAAGLALVRRQLSAGLAQPDMELIVNTLANKQEAHDLRQTMVGLVGERPDDESLATLESYQIAVAEIRAGRLRLLTPLLLVGGLGGLLALVAGACLFLPVTGLFFELSQYRF